MKRGLKLLSAALALLLLLLAGCAEENVQPTTPTTSLDNIQTGPLSLGDRMPELNVTTPEGETLVLSELLQKKKVVVLNFWFADCIWCIREFPVMEASYQKYKDDVEILALNPFDSTDSIVTFAQEHSLNFPMASCSRDLALAFGIGGYPTSVVIDREGKICLIHSGAITEARMFDQLFGTFTAEDYTSRVYNSISELF